MSLTDDASTTQTDRLAKRNLFSLLLSQPKIQQNQSPRDAHRAHTPSAMLDGWMERFVSSPSLFSGKYRTAVVQCHLAAKTCNTHFLFSGQFDRSGDSLLVFHVKLTD
jgi:hypothetical protein